MSFLEGAMQFDRNEEIEMEKLLNEIPHVTSPQYYHYDDDHDDHHHHRALPSQFPLTSHVMYGHRRAQAMDDVNNLVDRLQSVYISNESADPFLLTRNLGALPPMNSVLPFNGAFYENPNLGFSSTSIPNAFPPSKINGFDPYWDSNALNLSVLRSPTRSSSPVESFHNGYNLGKRRGVVSESLFGSVYDNLRCNIGSIYLLAKDQHGGRDLQAKLDDGKHWVNLIFDGVVGHVAELMKDPFGNYLMQRLFEVCSVDQKTTILLVLTEDPASIFRISLDCHGTRAVQKLIRTLKTSHQIALVMAALKPGLLDLMKDEHGNHVIQHCLTELRTEDTKFIIDAATKHCVDIATDQYGCCVLQRCIACSTGERRANLIAKVASDGLLLAQDAFGNYVVQNILDLKSPSANASLASQFEGNYVQLSMQKISSNVVEKCLRGFREDLKATILFELLSVSQFEQLLQHPYANYVIKTALSNTKGALHAALVNAIRPHADVPVLRTSPYSKRVCSLVAKKSCAA